MSSNWEDKLFHYKADPPPSAWDAIAAGLDAPKEAFPEKLYNYTEVPPATAWSAIEARLPAPQAKVIPMGGKKLRYAAAAVLLLAIASIAYFTTISNSPATTANQSAAATTNQPKAEVVLPPANKVIKHYNVPPQSSGARPTYARTRAERQPTYAMATSRTGNAISYKQQQASLPLEPLFANELEVVPQTKTIVDTDRTDRYMIATTEDGEPVRLPKKVYSAFACPEDDPRHKACELQLTLLQQKMSSSLTTDFVHFLDLLKNLQEN